MNEFSSLLKFFFLFHLLRIHISRSLLIHTFSSIYPYIHHHQKKMDATAVYAPPQSNYAQFYNPWDVGDRFSPVQMKASTGRGAGLVLSTYLFLPFQYPYPYHLSIYLSIHTHTPTKQTK